MASQLSSGINQNTINNLYLYLPRRSEEPKVVYFARQGKGLFAPISDEAVHSTMNFWMVHYIDNKVHQVTYVKRDPSFDCKTFAQCKNNLPKGINSILFLMGLYFKE